MIVLEGSATETPVKGHWRPLALYAVPRLSRGLWRSTPPDKAEGLQPAAPLRSMLSADSSRTRCPPEAPRLGRAPYRDAHRGQGSGYGPTTFLLFLVCPEDAEHLPPDAPGIPPAVRAELESVLHRGLSVRGGFALVPALMQSPCPTPAHPWIPDYSGITKGCGGWNGGWGMAGGGGSFSGVFRRLGTRGGP